MITETDADANADATTDCTCTCVSILAVPPNNMRRYSSWRVTIRYDTQRYDAT